MSDRTLRSFTSTLPPRTDEGEGTTELGRAAESIRATRGTEPAPSPRAVDRLVAHLRAHHELYSVSLAVLTGIVAIVGILVTLHQFGEQMAAQRHASAETTVNQFFTQIAELATEPGNGADEAFSEKVRALVISRAQMLIDGEHTGVHTDDILRFLATNGFGGHIGRTPLQEGPRIVIDRSAFEGLKLDDATFVGARVNCLDFDGARLERVRYRDGTIDHMRLRDSTLNSVDFGGSWLGYLLFDDVSLEGDFSFEGARLYASDLTGLRLGSEEARDRFVERVAKADSLYRTRFDPETDRALRRTLGEEGYTAKVLTPPPRLAKASDGGPIDRARLAHAWERECLPIRRRIR